MAFLDFLLEKNLIDWDLFELASLRTDKDDYICEILASSGDYGEEDLAKLKADYYGFGYTDLSEFNEISSLEYDEFKAVGAIPFRISGEQISVAISNPSDSGLKAQVNYQLATAKETKRLKPIYFVASKSKIERKFLEICSEKHNIDYTILDAISKDASDIHITPFEKTFKIMFRIDGTLVDYKTLDINEFEQMSIAIKVLSKLDISETRRPQSGRFQKGNVDFRVSTHPTTYGENIVIRILNKDKSIISIDNIGFSENQIKFLRKICSFSHGMIVFCGPTGSGKTTSIYALIETMNKKERNIMTLEDPIEYKISNVRQTEMIPGIISFADGVRSILRQDPDVILIGEIRDKETAQMAVRASMTGHLVLCTVHANDSFGAISRLHELDIPNSLIADNIIAIISQRLVRKKSEAGRTIVSEILKITPQLKELIYKGVARNNLYEQALKENFKSIYEDCREKMSKGIIAEEAARCVLLEC